VLLVLVPFDFALIPLVGRKLDRYLRVRSISLVFVGVGSVIGIFIQPLWPVITLAGAPAAAALVFGRRHSATKHTSCAADRSHPA
jgi:hypothetical protein